MGGFPPPSLQKLPLGFNLWDPWHRTLSYNVRHQAREGAKRRAGNAELASDVRTPGRLLGRNAVASVSNCVVPLCSLSF